MFIATHLHYLLCCMHWMALCSPSDTPAARRRVQCVHLILRVLACLNADARRSKSSGVRSCTRRCYKNNIFALTCYCAFKRAVSPRATGREHSVWMMIPTRGEKRPATQTSFPPTPYSIVRFLLRACYLKTSTSNTHGSRDELTTT